MLWTRDYCRSERLLERLVNDSEGFTAFQQVNALRELSKASEQGSRAGLDAIQRQRLAVWEQGVKKRALALGAPAQLEFQSASEALETYVAWLMGECPSLHWDPVIRCMVREPHAPERSSQRIEGEWEPSLEALVLLFARLKADLHAIDGDWSFYTLEDRFDGDTLESAIQLQQELEKTSEIEIIEPSRASLEKLVERASYYTSNIEELARHFQLFDTDTDPFVPDANLEARVGVRMSDLLAVEDYYETQVEKLTGVSAPRKNTSFLSIVPDVEPESQPAEHEEPVPTIQEATPEQVEPEQVTNSHMTSAQPIPEPTVKKYVSKKPEQQVDLSKLPVLTTQQTAQFLNMSIDRVRSLIKSNELPAKLSGRAYLITRENINKFLEPVHDEPLTGYQVITSQNPRSRFTR